MACEQLWQAFQDANTKAQLSSAVAVEATVERAAAEAAEAAAQSQRDQDIAAAGEAYAAYLECLRNPPAPSFTALRR